MLLLADEQPFWRNRRLAIPRALQLLFRDDVQLL
jgi:hypothetical protein